MIERVDIASLQRHAHTSGSNSDSVGSKASQFFDTIRRLFDDTVDHFIVSFTLKQRKSTIHMYRQSLVVFVETQDGGESREIPFSYAALSQPVRDEADSKRRHFLMTLFAEAEKLIAESQCQVMVKKRSAS